MHHIGVPTVQFQQQVAVRTDMESEFGIHRRVGRIMRLHDTGVNDAVAVLFHIGLQRTHAVESLYVGIDGEPLAGYLCLHVDMR